MKILIAHVQYRRRGGEEAVVEAEARLLAEAGHAVTRITPESAEFDSLSVSQRAGIALSAGTHGYGKNLIAEEIRRCTPDVVHFHNLYPLFGVGAMRAAAEMRCGVVQTLHNYRMSCIAGTHFLKGEVCELCTPGHPLPGVVRRCYRGSLMQSAAMAGSVSRQWAARDVVPDLMLALTPFASDRLVAAGMEPDRIVVKPNSVDRGVGGRFEDRDGVCCVSRLSPEKGVADLAAAWPREGPRLRIAGEGPESPRVRELARQNPLIECLGLLAPEDVRALIRASRVVVVPSKWFEGMPLTLLEAFSESTPALMLDVSARSAMADATLAGGASAGELSAAAVRLHGSRTEWVPMSEAAYARYEAYHTHEQNVRRLEAAYGLALEVARARMLSA